MGTKDFSKLQILLEHFDENPKLMTSSNEKDIILVLGKKDSGKSTCVNSLSKIPLQATKDNKIILKEPNSRAMTIGSETMFPRYLLALNHVIYEFPNMSDENDSLERFLNICIAKHLAESARSLKIIFIFNQEDYSSGKYEDIQSPITFASKLFPNNPIHEFSILVITKSYDLNAQEQFLSLLTKKNDKNFVLPWISKRRIFSMPKPVNGILMQNNTSLVKEIAKLKSVNALNPSLREFYNTDSPMFNFIEICNDYLESNRLNKISRINVDSQISYLTNILIKVQENLESKIEYVQNSIFTINYDNYTSESEKEEEKEIEKEIEKEKEIQTEILTEIQTEIQTELETELETEIEAETETKTKKADNEEIDFVYDFRRYGSMRGRNSIESLNSSLETSFTRELFFTKSNVYSIKCFSNDAYIYLSNEKEGRDKIAKATNEFNNKSLFTINLTDQGYLIQDIQTDYYLFVTKAYKRNDCYVVEGSNKYDSKNYFEIELKNDGCFTLKNKNKKEYVFISDTKDSSKSYLVLTKKTILDSSCFYIEIAR